MNTFYHYRQFADDVYNDVSKYPKAVVDEINHPSGFQARIYKDDTKKEVVLGIRGSEQFLKDFVVADGSILFGGIAEQQTFAMYNFINKHKAELQELKDQGYKIKLSGHSLGGFLTQIAAKSYPNFFDEFYTYNAPSAKGATSISHIYKDKNGEFIDDLRDNPSNSWLAEPMGITDKNILEPLYHFQNTPMTTQGHELRNDNDWSPIANLRWRDRYGDLSVFQGAGIGKVQGYDGLVSTAVEKAKGIAQPHQLTKNHIYEGFYLLALKGGESQSRIDSWIKKMKPQELEHQIWEMGKQAGIINWDSRTYDEIIKQLNEKNIFIRLADKGEIRFGIKDENNKLIAPVNTIARWYQDDIKVDNSQNYKMTQSDYQNMVNGFESMSIH